MNIFGERKWKNDVRTTCPDSWRWKRRRDGEVRWIWSTKNERKKERKKKRIGFLLSLCDLVTSVGTHIRPRCTRTLFTRIHIHYRIHLFEQHQTMKLFVWPRSLNWQSCFALACVCVFMCGWVPCIPSSKAVRKVNFLQKMVSFAKWKSKIERVYQYVIWLILLLGWQPLVEMLSLICFLLLILRPFSLYLSHVPILKLAEKRFSCDWQN